MDRIERTRVFGRHVICATATAVPRGRDKRWEVSVSAMKLNSGLETPLLRFPVAQQYPDEPTRAVDVALRDACARLAATSVSP